MNSTLCRLALVAFALAAGTVRAADVRPIYGLVAPTAGIAPGTTIEVQVVVLNRSTSGASFPLPVTLAGSIVGGGGRSEVVLQSRDTTPVAHQTIAPGEFGLRTYAMTVPLSASTGLATLEVKLADAGLSRTALDIAPSNASSQNRTTTPGQRPTTNLVSVQPAAAALRRSFADRLAPHEPTYFIYGPDDPAVKFQLSFKYKLLDFRDVAAQRMTRKLHFAYTQRSLWDIKAESSPFYDTSYMPELMYESLAPALDDKNRIFTWLGFQAAFKHESNGRRDPVSRSLNVIYARTALAIGRLDGWHLLAMPEVFGYLGTDENADIEDYRGYGKLQLVLGRSDGPSLSAGIWAGKGFDNVSTQLDLTIPIRTQLLHFETYLLFQYFNGYGESLLSYNEHSETIRAGFSLIR